MELGAINVDMVINVRTLGDDLRKLADRIDPPETHSTQSNLVRHALNELAILHEHKPIDELDPMDRRMHQNIIQLVDAFARQHHSGFSSSYAQGILQKVLDFLPITPLTGAEDEWVKISDEMYQNKRCGRVFSKTGTPDGEAYDSEGKIFVDDARGGAYTNQDSRVPITFPYTPVTERVIV